MSEFSHLEPAERLYMARHRLGMLSDTMIAVLELHEQMKAFASSRFYRSGRHDAAVDLLFDTIANYEVVHICRLWDRCDADRFSLSLPKRTWPHSAGKCRTTHRRCLQPPPVVNFIGQRQRLFKESYDLPAFLCDIQHCTPLNR
jgi:hypothetical protein